MLQDVNVSVTKSLCSFKIVFILHFRQKICSQYNQLAFK